MSGQNKKDSSSTQSEKKSALHGWGPSFQNGSTKQQMFNGDLSHREVSKNRAHLCGCPGRHRIVAPPVHLSTGSATEMEGLHWDFASCPSQCPAFFCNSIQGWAWPFCSSAGGFPSPLFSHHHSGGVFRRQGCRLTTSTGLENCPSSSQKLPEAT